MLACHFTFVNTFYCCPSGFSELRPALKISSVDNKLIAITELELDHR